MRKRKKVIKSNGYKIPIEDLLDATQSQSEGDFYDLVFSGVSECVRPVWPTVSPRSQEEYWVLNQPYLRLVTRLTTISLPDKDPLSEAP